MREILFKAKRIDNGEWVEGYYAYFDNEHSIIYPKCNGMWIQIIDISTLCQYTGLTDKNGCKIWENDIIRTQKFVDKPYSKNFEEKDYIGVVEYKIYSTNDFNNPQIPNHNYKAEWIVKLTEKIGKCSYSSWSKFYDCEVIGNKFDNPELLGV